MNEDRAGRKKKEEIETNKQTKKENKMTMTIVPRERTMKDKR